MRLERFLERSEHLTGYSPGVTPEELAMDLGVELSEILKLNANENLFLPVEFMRSILAEASRETDPRLYPTVEGQMLEKAISDYLGISPEQVVLGAGSDDLIEMVLYSILRDGDELLAATPTFSMYERGARIVGAEFKAIDLGNDFSLNVKSLLSAVTARTNVIVLCNPNNPTANQFPREEVLRLIEGFDGIVLLDEAYSEFAGYSLVGETSRLDNLIVLRTFSKAFGLAGIRLGFAVANEVLARTLKEKYRVPYPLSPVAMRVGVKLLENREVVEGATEEMKRQRGRLIDELNRIDGVRAFPSETNFVLFSLNRDQDEVYSRLLGKGIIIRRIGHVPGCGGCLRVTVAPSEVSMRFLKTLREVV